MRRFWDIGSSKLSLAVLTACLITHTAPAQSSFVPLAYADYPVADQTEFVSSNAAEVTDTLSSGFNTQTDSFLIIDKLGVVRITIDADQGYASLPIVPTVQITTRIDPQTGPPLDIVSPVPEPSAIALMLTGAGLLIARCYWRK